MDNKNTSITGIRRVDLALDAVAKVTGVSLRKIMSNSRRLEVSEARRLAILVLYGFCTYTDIAETLHRRYCVVYKSHHVAQFKLENSVTFRDKYCRILSILADS